MKRLVSLLIIFCIGLSISGCSPNTESSSILNNNVINSSSTNYLSNLREYAISLYNINENNLGFSAVNTRSDKLRADYIEEVFNEIGLKNIQRIPIEFNSWSNGGVTFTFSCNCEDGGYLTLRRTGSYPINYNFANHEFNVVYIGDGGSDKYIEKNVSGQGILIDPSDDLQGQINEAIKHNPAFIMYYSDIKNYPAAYSLDINLEIDSNIPIFVLSKGNYSQIRKSMIDDMISVTITGNTSVDASLETSDFIIGEIEGRNKDKYVYVTAHRDAIQSGFMTSCVSVSELFLMADKLIKENYKPAYTIRFMVTTGQEWGIIGQGENIGIEKYLDSLSESDLKKIQSVLVVDGNYPILDTIYTETQINNSDLKNKLESYTTEFIDKTDYPYIHSISDLDISDNARTTEALAWDKKGVSTVLMSEHKNSKYKELDGTSGDNVEKNLDSKIVNFIINYYTGVIKELTK